MDVGYLKWLHFDENNKSIIYEVNFLGRKDVALSVRFAIEECLYEFNMKRKITDAIAEDEITYLKRIHAQNYDLKDQKVVKEYVH